MRVRGSREGEGRFGEGRGREERAIDENTMVFPAFLTNMMGSEQSSLQQLRLAGKQSKEGMYILNKWK